MQYNGTVHAKNALSLRLPTFFCSSGVGCQIACTLAVLHCVGGGHAQ